MDIQIITAPFIGGMIGLVTNSLAIKMLFRPYKELRIMGIPVPFTPGLIPKEKKRIAHAVAQVISNYILDQNTILDALASDAIYEAYAQAYDRKLNEWKTLDITFEEWLEKSGLIDSANNLEINLRETISNYVVEQCQKQEASRKIIELAFSQFQENMNPLMYKMGKMAFDVVKESMIGQMDQFIREHGNELVGQYIDGIYGEWMDKPVCEAVSFIESKIETAAGSRDGSKKPDLKQLLWEKYTEFIQNKASQFLSVLKINEVIENKINDYDLAELEKMIMEISKKELNALVWLGGLLGVIMGFVNLIF